MPAQATPVDQMMVNAFFAGRKDSFSLFPADLLFINLLNYEENI